LHDISITDNSDEVYSDIHDQLKILLK